MREMKDAFKQNQKKNWLLWQTVISKLGAYCHCARIIIQSYYCWALMVYEIWKNGRNDESVKVGLNSHTIRRLNLSEWSVSRVRDEDLWQWTQLDGSRQLFVDAICAQVISIFHNEKLGTVGPTSLF